VARLCVIKTYLFNGIGYYLKS